MVTRTVGLTAALVLGCAALAAADARNIDRTLPLSATGTVALDAHNGWIQVKTWDRPQVEVHVRIEWTGVSASSARFPTVDVDGSSDRVSIRWNRRDAYDWTFWDLFSGSWGAPEVHYDITAPKTARLQIHNHNANTDIRDFSGPLELIMHNGRARVDFASFTQASRVAMHNGLVEFALPSASKFNFDSSGHHARVDSDFSPGTHAVAYGRYNNTIAATVNGGGPDLRVVSHNGSVRLRSK